MTQSWDHGGGLDAAIQRFGGTRQIWLDLSTGINPMPYPIPELTAEDWGRLPDAGAFRRLEMAARKFWAVPDDASVLAAPGASALIARLPALREAGTVQIRHQTYNEHAAAFRANGWQVTEHPAASHVVVHPNNPDGAFWENTSDAPPTDGLLIIDESFCDVVPDKSLIAKSSNPNTLVLKSFGKFWGLAGARLGFAIGRPETLAPLGEMLGPWQVSGPALHIGTAALDDNDWAAATRTRLGQDAWRLDALLAMHGAKNIGGTDLFRLYEVTSAEDYFEILANGQILSRVFPYSSSWLRLGLPGNEADWSHLETALAAMK